MGQTGQCREEGLVTGGAPGRPLSGRRRARCRGAASRRGHTGPCTLSFLRSVLRPRLSPPTVGTPSSQDPQGRYAVREGVVPAQGKRTPEEGGGQLTA